MSSYQKNLAYIYMFEHLKYCTQINEYWLNKNAGVNIVLNCSIVINTFSEHIIIFRTLSIDIWQLICQQTINKKWRVYLFIICRIIKFFFFTFLRETTLESKVDPTNRNSSAFLLHTRDFRTLGCFPFPFFTKLFWN